MRDEKWRTAQGREIPIVRVPGVAVFMTGLADGVPPLLLHHLRPVRSLHEIVIFVTVTTLPDTVAPPAPTLSGHVRGPSQVRLTWNRVEDDTSEFVTYRIFADGTRVTRT